MKLRNPGILFFRWIAPLLVLGGAMWFVYAMGSRQKPNRKKAPPRKSVPVEVVQAKQHTGPLDIVASGVAIPYREVRLSAQVGGEVIFKAEALSPGQFVVEGDVLLRIDPLNYQIEVARLEQELAKATVELDRLKVDKENAERLLTINRRVVDLRRQSVKRLEQLRQANASSITERDATELAMLTAVEQSTVHENTIRQFDNQTKTMEASRDLVALQLKRAKLDLDRTSVIAPFSGVVIANHVERNGTIAAGAPIATIEDTSMVEVRCHLRAEDLDFIHDTPGRLPEKDAVAASQLSSLGDPYRLPPISATVELQRAGRMWTWDGVLSRQDGLGIDERTRTMPVRIRVAKPACNAGQLCSTEPSELSLADPRSLALVRGMFVRIKLHCNSSKPLLTIPESVVRPGKTVWLMQGDKLKIQSVRIVRVEDGLAYLDGNSELSDQSQIIRSPVPNVKNGLAVSLIGKKKKQEAPSKDYEVAADRRKLQPATGAKP